MKEFNFLYKTTNLLTKKYYIGVHSTNNMDDGYMGSGLHLKRSLSKYGIANHKREVISFCNSAENAYLLESKKVTERLLKNPMCMNLSLGGHGGNLGDEINKKRGDNQRGKNNPMYGKGYLCSGMNNPMYGTTGDKSPNYGIPMTEEQKIKIHLSYRRKIISDKDFENLVKEMKNTDKYHGMFNSLSRKYNVCRKFISREYKKIKKKEL
jgi:hypothetical protein